MGSPVRSYPSGAGSMASHYLKPGPHYGRSGAYFSPKEEGLTQGERRVDLSGEWRVPLETQPSPFVSTLLPEILRIYDGMNERMCREKMHCPGYLITEFVAYVEEAIQYFELKEFVCSGHVRQVPPIGRHDPNDLLVELLPDLQMFEKLDKSVILHVLREYSLRLKGEKLARIYKSYLLFLINNNSIHSKSRYSEYESTILHEFSDLDPCDLEGAFEWYTSSLTVPHTGKWKEGYLECIEELHKRRVDFCCKPQNEDPMLTWRPLYNIVYQTLLSGISMSNDPEIEIQKLALVDEWFSYHFCKDAPLIDLLRQARTAVVSNIPLNASESDVIHLFPQWVIEEVNMERGETSQIANVVFEDYQVTLGEIPTLFDMPITIKPLLGVTLRQAVSMFIESEAAAGLSLFCAEQRDAVKEARATYQRLRLPKTTCGSVEVVSEAETSYSRSSASESRP